MVGTDYITSSAGELGIYKSFEDLVEYLATKTANINSDIRVLHGVLTSATTIPQDFCGRQAYILVSTKDGYGITMDSDSDNDCVELASEIEKLLSEEETELHSIEDVFILYGYEINVILSVDEGDVDEEMMKMCAEAGRRAKALEKLKQEG